MQSGMKTQKTQSCLSVSDSREKGKYKFYQSFFSREIILEERKKVIISVVQLVHLIKMLCTFLYNSYFGSGSMEIKHRCKSPFCLSPSKK